MNRSEIHRGALAGVTRPAIHRPTSPDSEQRPHSSGSGMGGRSHQESTHAVTRLPTMLQPTGNSAVMHIGAIAAREGETFNRAGHEEVYIEHPHRFTGTAYSTMRATRNEFDVAGGQPGSTVGSTRYFATEQRCSSHHGSHGRFGHSHSLPHRCHWQSPCGTMLQDVFLLLLTLSGIATGSRPSTSSSSRTTSSAAWSRWPG